MGSHLLTYIIMALNVVVSLCLVALISSANGGLVPDSGSARFVRSSFGSGSGDSRFGSGFVVSGFGSGSGGSGFAGFGGVGGSGQGAGRDTVVVTQTRTIDQIETRVSTVYNTQPVTQTDF